jgi:hypothetical protein
MLLLPDIRGEIFVAFIFVCAVKSAYSIEWGAQQHVSRRTGF